MRANVVSSFSQFEGAKASLIADKERLRAARLALEGSIEERRVGQRTTLDVLNSQSAVIDAQIALTQSERNYKVAGYAILSSIGHLSARKLDLRVAEYNPNDHLKAVEDKWFGLKEPPVEIRHIFW